MEEESIISTKDVQALASANTGEQRSEVARKLSMQYASSAEPGKKGFNPDQMKMVEEIFRLMVKDTDAAVRRQLSQNLNLSRHIPKDIVLSLAKDVEDIASPMLEISDLLEDRDLMAIIKSASSQHQKAIAKRKKLSGGVSDALVDTKDAEVVKTLLSNEGAEVEEGTYAKVLEQFSEDEEMMEVLLTKHGLPDNLIEVFQQRISGKIRENLESKYKKNMEDLARARYRERVAFIHKKVEIKTLEVEVIRVLKDIENGGALDLVNAICTGHQDLYLKKLSKESSLPEANLKKLYKEGDREGINKLLNKAGVPEELVHGVRIASRVLMEMKNPFRHRDGDVDAFTREYVTAIKERARGRKGEAEAGYLIKIIKHYAEEEMAARLEKKQKKAGG